MSSPPPEKQSLQNGDAVSPSQQVLDVSDLYRKHSLSPGQCSIRVLDLDYQPDPDSTAQLRASMRVVQLDGSTDFTALSYVWGDRRSPPHFLRCESVDIPITSNLHSALIHLRQKKRVTIWIDAISINQTHETEKSVQITLMGAIYSQARTVYIWLGPGSERTDIAMAWLHHHGLRRYWAYRPKLAYSRNILTFWEHFGHWLWDALVVPPRRDYPWPLIAYWRRSPDRTKKAFTIGLSPYPEGLTDILDCEWLARAWTFQECILAHNPVILCGSKSASWQRLLVALAIERHRTWPHPPLKSSKKEAWAALIMQWYTLPRGQMTIASKQSAVPDQSAAAQCARPSLHYSTQAKSFLEQQREFATYLNPHPDAPRVWFPWLFCIILLFWCTFTVTIWIVMKGATRWIFLSILIVLFMFWLLRSKRLFVETFAVNIPFNKHRAGTATDTLEGIIQALRTRNASDSRDKCYALHGVLAALGVPMQTADYNATKHVAYGTFLSDLVRWDESLGRLILDAGFLGIPDVPSWTPEWEAPNQRSRRHPWLPKSYIYKKHSLHLTSGSRHTVRLLQLSAGTQLVMRGLIIDRVKFSRSVSRGPLKAAPSSDTTNTEGLTITRSEATLSLLLHWIRAFQVSQRRTADSQPVAKAIFGILEVGKKLKSKRDLEGFDGWYAIIFDYLSNLRLDGILESDMPGLQMRIDRSDGVSNYHKRLTRPKMRQRSFIVTDGGYAGCSPPSTCSGDCVALLAGVPTPVVLRKSTAEGYLFVGPAYIDGMMQGESWDRGRHAREITLV